MAGAGRAKPGGAPVDPETAAKDICLRLLTTRPRSRAELAAKLREREIPDEVSERVLDRLAAVRLVDDAAFAESFVRAKHRDRGLGRAALMLELRRKGVDNAVAAAAASVVDDDAERSRAVQLVSKKLDAAVFAGPVAARRRLLGMLARRGYRSSIAISVVNEALRGYADPIDEADSELGDLS